MITIDLSDLRTLAEDFAARARRASIQGLLAIESAAVEEAPHRSGNLVNAITTAADGSGGQVFVSGAAPYAQYVHEGTGIFGPKGQRIKPTSKRALFWPGASHPMRSIAGMRPNPFMDRGASRATDPVVRAFEEALQ